MANIGANIGAKMAKMANFGAKMAKMANIGAKMAKMANIGAKMANIGAKIVHMFGYLWKVLKLY